MFCKLTYTDRDDVECRVEFDVPDAELAEEVCRCARRAAAAVEGAFAAEGIREGDLIGMRATGIRIGERTLAFAPRTTLGDMDGQVAEHLGRISRMGAAQGRNTVIAMDGDRALVMRSLPTRTEFVVAYGYDPATGSWGHGSYSDSVATAAAEFEGRAISRSTDVFLADFWCDEDIAARLELHGMPADGAAVERVKDEIRPERWLREALTETGHELIDDAVLTLREEMAPREPRPATPSTESIRGALSGRAAPERAAGNGHGKGMRA